NPQIALTQLFPYRTLQHIHAHTEVLLSKLPGKNNLDQRGLRCHQQLSTIDPSPSPPSTGERGTAGSLADRPGGPLPEYRGEGLLGRTLRRSYRRSGTLTRAGPEGSRPCTGGLGMNLSEEMHAETTVIAVAGRLDGATATTFEKAMNKAVATSGHGVV